MSQELSPEMRWMHQLHQLTGMLAIRGNRLTKEDRKTMMKSLSDLLLDVSVEMARRGENPHDK